MFKDKIRVGIVGGTGLLSGVLIKLLITHPRVAIECIISESAPDISIDINRYSNSPLQRRFPQKTLTDMV